MASSRNPVSVASKGHIAEGSSGATLRGAARAHLGRVLSFLFLCCAVFAAIVLVVIPAATASHSYSVLTGSMRTSYPQGTFLVVKPTPIRDIGVGDVVTYQLESGRPEVVTHRVISIAADQQGHPLLYTQGDNNSVADEKPVQEIQLRGKLLYAVPYAGFAANWIGNQDRDLALKILATGLIGYGMFIFIQGLRRIGKPPNSHSRTENKNSSTTKDANAE